MGLPSIGVPSLILIIVLALIIFGPKKLPEIGKATGQTLREFKNSTKDVIEDEDGSDKTNQDTNNTDSDSKSNQT